MKKAVLIAALLLATVGAMSQQVASRAKAMRMMSFSRPEYQIKDIKVYADTMSVYSLANYVIYPFGEWESVEQYITDNQLSWYRDIGYKNYFDSMEVSVNRMSRVDGSYIDMYYSIWTKKVELLSGYILDKEVTLANGIHTGMTKDEVMNVFFKRYPKSYTADVLVLKVISGAGEVAEIYTFKGTKLRHIKIETAYKYY
ncbi:MAG: hypothetical protein IKR83_03455 [Bacteroidales bacterium]|nr:hypothetical protein [Bacteroidales bacterium]